MIVFDDVSVRYPEAVYDVLHRVNLEIPEGELCLVVGATGSGKSTLLGCVNGLVPHFTGGDLTGRITVDGRTTRDNRPAELADVVGYVGQDPLAGFVSEYVEEELAYAMESLGTPNEVMRKRVTETVDLLGLAELRDRPLSSLSAGQRQRVAIGAALTAQPRVLVLDEPTSALDPGAAEEVLAALHRLVHDLGVTVILAEHRLERVVQYADRVVLVRRGQAGVTAGEPGEVLRESPVAPPVVRLAKAMAWPSIPVSVRQARRAAADLRQRLTDAAVTRLSSAVAAIGEPTAAADDTADARPTGADDQLADTADARPSRADERPSKAADDQPPSTPVDEPRSKAAHVAGRASVAVRKLTVRYPGVEAVRGIALDIAEGERVAVMGRNGSGKSSLLWAMQGTGRRDAGTVHIGDQDPKSLAPRERRELAGLVPAEPTDLLYAETVAAECEQADRESAAPPGRCRDILSTLVSDVDPAAHPRDLSEGQRLALAVAVSMTAQPSLLLMDEPTRGLDYPAKTALATMLRGMSVTGKISLVTTHDVEFAAEYATRVIVLSDGEIVADGPARDIVTSSAIFAPQVAKVLAPAPYLTVSEVVEALREVRT